MAKDPAFLFYPNDWDGGTKLFNRHQKGAYIDLLMCQFHNGHMTSHDVGHILGQDDYDQLWESKLKSKFKQDSDGKFYNEKLENEQLKRKNWCESRRNNKDGHNQYTGHMTKHMSGHMVNVNVNEVVVVSKKNNKTNISNINTKGFTTPTLEEVTAYCSERKNNVNPNKFIDHYQANGWLRGKTKIKDWKACVRTWENNEGFKNAPTKKMLN